MKYEITKVSTIIGKITNLHVGLQFERQMLKAIKQSWNFQEIYILLYVLAERVNS